MDQSMITLIIVAAVMVLYATELLPLSITTILAMVTMVFTGILTPAEAFSGFSSTATILLIGITIVGEAFLTSGLVDKLGNTLIKISHIPLPLFLGIIMLISAFLSAFLNGLAVVAIFMPILDALAIRTDQKIARKYTYMPLAVGAVLGGNLSVIGSTSILNASNLLEESYYGHPFGFFGPTLAALPAVVAAFLFYCTIGQKLQDKWFDFEESECDDRKSEQRHEHDMPASWKAYLVVGIMLLCIIGFVIGLDLGAVSLAGAAAVIIGKCISKKRAYASISWETVFLVAGAIGFAKGMETSGAGEIIADAVIRHCDFLVNQQFGFCVVIIILSTVLSNFMSNNAAVTIIVPIALSIAKGLGYNPLPLIMACGIGVNLSLATPICTACVTMTTVVGYRFKDYMKIGGMINLLSVIVTIAAFYVLF